MTHCLKTWPDYFKDVKEGRKSFELRRADREFEVGDTVILQEYDPDKSRYSGKELHKRIIYILGDFAGLNAGYCIFQLEDIERI